MFKKRSILYHVFFWSILYLLWIFFFQTHSFTITRTITVQFCYLIFIAADFYVINYFLAFKFLKKGWVPFVLLSLAVVGVSALLRAGVAAFMNAHFFLPGQTQPLFADLFSASLVNIFVWVSITCAGKMLYDKFQSHRYIAFIEKQKSANELNFLRAQINPHFLFNSINSVYGNIDKNNKVARNMLLQFSEMLRYQLYDCNDDRVNLGKEINYLRNYIALQQYRKEESLIVHFHADDSLGDETIAPLILVVFVENAFKHVSNLDDRENKITISLERCAEQLSFSVLNTTETNHHPDGGIGLTNVKRRLEILYPGKHQLEIRKGNETFEVQLKIDL